MATDTQKMTEACMAAGKLAPQHELLRNFEGTWRAEVKMWMGPGPETGAEPMVSHGTMETSLIFGGKFLEQAYRDDSGMFEGKGYLGYNTVEQRWEAFWIDTMATFMMTEHGQHDESTKSWTMVDELRDPGSGHMMKKRTLVTLHDDGTNRMETWFTPSAGPNAGKESKCMEINYTKA
tara:strand:- start:128 stop:661 length:534 start_codon:yes stop_codon:yes gene_type:complete